MPKRGAPPLEADLLQGTLDLLILQTLLPGPAHGHTIAHVIEHRSDEVLQVEHGSLYPALHRLEDRGWIASFWGTSENNRKARYYRLTSRGKKQLQQQASRWEQLVRAVNRVLLWSAFSLGTTQHALLMRVILPACYPRVFATLRIALPVALITTFTAEMVAGGGGMGATLVYSQRFFESPTVFAYILVMLGIGLLLDAAVRAFARRYLAWAEE